jgi:hypothetical protein
MLIKNASVADDKKNLKPASTLNAKIKKNIIFELF